jgi:hypothetical protein
MASLNSREEFDDLAAGLADLCRDISVREDENGFFVLAFGLKDVHSLELRRAGGSYLLELWHGATAEDEIVAEELRLGTPAEALVRARAWLQNDAI